MTNKQIIKMALEKAIKNGFKWEQLDVLKPTLSGGWCSRIEVGNTCILSVSTQGNTKKACSFYDLIFNPSFAKALWGEGEVWEQDFNCPYPDWLFNLQVMVSKKEPIKYLEELLNER